MPSQVRRLLMPLLVALVGMATASSANAQLYWKIDGTGGTWTSTNWGTAPGGPFATGWTANSDAVFQANSSITFVTTTQVGNITVSPGATVTMTSAGTFSTNGNVRTFDVGAGSILDFANQNISTVPGTGLIKSGAGIYFSSNGNTYNGGFTLNAGIMILGGTAAMGGNNSTLNINGGTFAANATRNLPTGRFSVINVGGDFTFGAVTTGVASGNGSATANITFADPVNLGAATRQITIGANGSYSLTGIVSGGVGSGITVTNAGGATGAIVLGNSNTYSGPTTVNGGILRMTNAAAIANSPTITVANGATLEWSPSAVSAFTFSNTQTIQGSGNVTGGTNGNAFTINGGVSPGAAVVGTLTFNRPVTLNSTATYAWDLNNAAPTIASVNTGGSDATNAQDLLAITGDNPLGFTSGNTFKITELTTPTFTPGQTYSWTVNTTGAAPSAPSQLAGVTFDVSAAPTFDFYGGAAQLSLVTTGSAVYLNFTPVPEPATVLGICAAVGGIGYVVRRRRTI